MAAIISTRQSHTVIIAAPRHPKFIGIRKQSRQAGKISIKVSIVYGI